MGMKLETFSPRVGYIEEIDLEKEAYKKALEEIRNNIYIHESSKRQIYQIIDSVLESKE